MAKQRFRNWIKASGGPIMVGRMIGVESPTVKEWLNGRASPKALRMQELVRLGKGAFSYDDIINETKRIESRK